MSLKSLSIALTGSGGAGVLTAGHMLLKAAGAAGYHGLMRRSVGPQIRGGESAALLRLAVEEVHCPGNVTDVLVGFDWNNVERFAKELAIGRESLVIADSALGDLPDIITEAGATVVNVPISEIAKSIPGGRPNMVGLGLVAELTGLPLGPFKGVVAHTLQRKGQAAIDASLEGLEAGAAFARDLESPGKLAPPEENGTKWNVSGNQATALGALKAGVRFVAAYPITPATDILEWMASALPKMGGQLIQAEDELSAINMCLGASFGGTPTMTSTSGPGLSLMTETLGLAVAAELPVLVVNVQRGGPSTGLPTKSEQADLNVAVYGLHGDAPQIVTAPLSIADCQFTSQWSVYLAESLQCPVILLSEQVLGQSRAIIRRPADMDFVAARKTPSPEDLAPEDLEAGYQRYALTDDGVSPMALPGTAGGEHTIDGLEHNVHGDPSPKAEDHQAQLDKRRDKLTRFDYAEHWADVSGAGEVAVITFGSIFAPVREALNRLAEQGVSARHVALRLVYPPQPEKMAAALKGVTKTYVVEQNHDAQLHKFLRAHYDLSGEVVSYHRPGPLPMGSGEIMTLLSEES